ncbi:MAG: hypothetical protein LBE09_06990 [Christensenellaceae bacterium]|nr:hypothetical protein [Christensenellaceae bacterium]
MSKYLDRLIDGVSRIRSKRIFTNKLMRILSILYIMGIIPIARKWH